MLLLHKWRTLADLFELLIFLNNARYHNTASKENKKAHLFMHEITVL